MADMTTKVKIPVMPFYGDTEMELEFPSSWHVDVCKMEGHDTRALTDEEIRQAFAKPIGTKPISELAKGRKEVVILFDDLARGTPASVIVPYVLEELASAGITDEHIRFIAAVGAHGAMNGIELTKKLGEDVMRRFCVYNHNPYENCMPLGMTYRGTPVAINGEFMACDLKIGIGSIVPHPFGFGGGCKIILPGVASIETINGNHARLTLSPTTRMGNFETNVMMQDIVETARMVRLEVKIDCIMNMKREITALFVGDPVAEHLEGIKLAREHYATPLVNDCDVVVANCYMKANEHALSKAIASPLLKKSGGDMVVISVYPAGQIVHYFGRTFGKNLSGRGYNLPGFEGGRLDVPLNARSLTLMTPYPDRTGADWLAPYHVINYANDWDEVLDFLKRRNGERTKVAVIPDATIQYFPEALGTK
jgi:nickel-dependent lactate racemase